MGNGFNVFKAAVGLIIMHANYSPGDNSSYIENTATYSWFHRMLINCLSTKVGGISVMPYCEMNDWEGKREKCRQEVGEGERRELTSGTSLARVAWTSGKA